MRKKLFLTILLVIILAAVAITVFACVTEPANVTDVVVPFKWKIEHPFEGAQKY